MQVHLLGKHISKTDDEIERAIARPTYFNPYEAVEFGIIDRVCLSALQCSLMVDIYHLPFLELQNALVYQCHARHF